MEQSLFIKFFGNNSNIRVIDYLIKYRGLDYSMSDIARNSGVGWATLSRLWQEFVKYKIVVPTREIGKAKLFKLNEDNEAVKELIDAYKKLLLQETENYFTKKVKVKA